MSRKGEAYHKLNIKWPVEKLHESIFDAMLDLNIKYMPTETELKSKGFDKLCYGIKRNGGYKTLKEELMLQSKKEYHEMINRLRRS